MSIVFIVFGNKEFGLGHLSRSRNIIAILNDLNHKVITIQNINPFYISVNHIIEEGNYAKFLEKARKILDSIECDRILIDLPFSRELKENIPKLFGNHKSTKIIAFDFFDYDSEFIDIVVNQYNQFMIDEEPQITVYEGIKFSIIRKEFWNLRREKYETKADELNIIISCGGTDPALNTEKALNLCKQWQDKGLKLNVKAISDRLKSTLDVKNSEILSSPPNFPEMLAKADISMLSGGITVLESSYLGTPAIAFAQSELEANFIKFLEDKGLLVPYNSPDIDRILSTDFREKMSANQRNQVDNKGIKRIIELILE